jgi:phosphoribosyl-ATP pyrophosphohydrolase/phosphoribosyl-AMP cyclohydrolase
MTNQEFLEAVHYDEKGLVPVIAQDVHAKKVRMLAYMNKEALQKTLETGKMYYYSRSRQSLWLKGETSGHYQHVRGASIDCDGDTLVFQIEQEGGVSCHTGNQTCFYRELGSKQYTRSNPETTIEANSDGMLKELYDTIVERKNNPKEGSYTNYLLEKGTNKILKKVGEEATEIVIAAKEEGAKGLVGEVADLLYHLSVLMVEKELDWDQVAVELEKRK